MIYVLLLEKYKGKRAYNTNAPEYKVKTNSKDKVKSIVYYKIRYSKS